MFAALRLFCLSLMFTFLPGVVSAAEGLVPRTFEETQAAGRAAAPAIVAKYEAIPRAADPAYAPFLATLQLLKPGSADPAGEAALKELMALAVKKGGDEAKELRSLYDDQFTPLMQDWQEALQSEGAEMELRARLANLHRVALRELTRDLMRDTNAVAILHARDLVKYGNETGPTFDQLFAKEKAKAGATDESAWAAIVASSQRHNKGVSEAARGTAPAN